METLPKYKGDHSSQGYPLYCKKYKDQGPESRTYVIEGNPTPLARARWGQGRIYDTQKHIKLITGITIANQHTGVAFFTGPLELEITFFFKTPNNMKKLMGNPHITRPDLSNMIKFIEDVATGITYHDDCLIASIIARKLYDNTPRTEFTIRQL